APNLADRRTPHPHKVTVPLMAVSVGPDGERPPEQPGGFFAPGSLKDKPPLKTPHPPPKTRNHVAATTAALTGNPLQRWDGGRVFPSARFVSPDLDDGMRNHRLALFLPATPEFVPENADAADKSYLLEAGKTLKLDAALVVASGPINVALREWLRAARGLPQ